MLHRVTYLDVLADVGRDELLRHSERHGFSGGHGGDRHPVGCAAKRTVAAPVTGQNVARERAEVVDPDIHVMENLRGVEHIRWVGFQHHGHRQCGAQLFDLEQQAFRFTDAIQRYGVVGDAVGQVQRTLVQHDNVLTVDVEGH